MIAKEEMRTAMLIGENAVETLRRSSVAVFGIGGVGSYVCEAIARAGVGRIDLFDGDTVALSNINRQLIALHSTVGMPKAEAMRARILDINPQCDVRAHNVFYTPQNADEYDLSSYGCIADAVDSIGAKTELAVRAVACGTPIVASMGTGNKADPSLFRVSDISDTQMCPLARIMRKELKKRGINHLRVVYSPEAPISPLPADDVEEDGAMYKKRHSPGSLPYVPGAAGLVIAGEMIRILLDGKVLHTERTSFT